MIAMHFQVDTMFSSRPEFDHPYFQTLIAWGKAFPETVIPWLLNHLRSPGNWHWTYALRLIVGKDNAPQVSEKQAGRVDRIIELWLEWGKTHGYLRVEPR